MAATQHITTNNLHMFQEDTRFSSREVEHHAIPNLRNLLNHVTEAKQTSEQGPLSQRYMESSVQAVMMANSPTLQEYWDKDFSNVTTMQHSINSLSFNTLAANIDLQSLTLGNQPDRLENPVMDWIVPDGQNKKLREHRNKSMAEGTSPDGVQIF